MEAFSFYPKRIFLSKRKIGYIALIGLSWTLGVDVFAQQNNVCGFVYDAFSHEPIIGVTITDSTFQKGVISDYNGFFCYPVSSGKELLIASFVGYQKKLIRVDDMQDSIFAVYLEPGYKLEEVVITSHLADNRTSLLRLTPSQVKQLPTLTGEPDIMKAYQLMPGIQMGDEGSSGLYVRGGTPDQNLYLLDDVPLYYINHLGGFFSVFDVNAIKNITLYKGDYPARYGGRLSSVVDIRLKDGNVSGLNQEFMIGTLLSKYFIEGPLKKPTTTFMFSARRSNLDLFMRPISSANSGGREIVFTTFYDLNGKLVHNLNTKNKLVLIVYQGRDKFQFNDKSLPDPISNGEMNSSVANHWGNVVGAFNWNHVINNTWFYALSTGYTRFFNSIIYKYTFESPDEYSYDKGKLSNYVEDYFVTNRLKFNRDPFKWEMGLSWVHHRFQPSSLEFLSERAGVTEDTVFSNRMNAPELQLYGEGEWNIRNLFIAKFGFHAMYWPLERYFSIDPRISLSYKINQSLTINGSYTQMHQYVHLLTHNSSGIPSDLWIPSTRNIQPGEAEQISLGITYSLKKVQISLEAFQKNLRELVAYKEGRTVFNTPDWQESIETGGIGKVKGIEFLLRKEKGRHTGWIGYTWSRNRRQFDNLNGGNEFPFKYDRPHEINLVYSFRINDHFSLSSTWVYASGQAITIAQQKYPVMDFDYNGLDFTQFEFHEAHYYGGINSYRTEAYHRLDLGVNFTKELKKSTRTIHLGVYNLYNRKNPYYYYYAVKNGERKLYKYTLFPIIPSLSVSYQF